MLICFLSIDIYCNGQVGKRKVSEEEEEDGGGHYSGKNKKKKKADSLMVWAAKKEEEGIQKRIQQCVCALH